MSRSGHGTEEHAFKKIQRDIERNEMSNPLFFYGEEQYLAKWAVDTILKRYVAPELAQLNCARLSGETATVSDIIAQCETLPMMAEKRVVIVEGFIAGSEQSKAGFNEDEEKEFVEYIKALPESSLLILVSDSVDKRRKLYKAIAVAGSCYEFTRLDEKEVRGFIVKRLVHSGKKAEASVIRRLIETSGYFDRQSDYTLYNLDNDLKKLIAHSDGDEIKLSDVSGGMSGNTESYVFDMIDAISKDRKGDALTLFHGLISSGENIHGLLALICSHYELILKVKEMIDAGFGSEEIKEWTGAHAFRIKIATGLAGRYSAEQLRKILSRCFDVDKTIKTGLLEDRLAMEMLIAGI